MLLKQVKESEDRHLIRDSVTDLLDAGKAVHGRRHIDQVLFHGRIAERMPLLQQMDPQHRGQRIRKAAACLAHFWVVSGSIKQINTCQGHHRPFSERNFNRLVCFLTGGKPVMNGNHNTIDARISLVFQSLLSQGLTADSRTERFKLKVHITSMERVWITAC